MSDNIDDRLVYFQMLSYLLTEAHLQLLADKHDQGSTAYRQRLYDLEAAVGQAALAAGEIAILLQTCLVTAPRGTEEDALPRLPH